jgi:hypothetical protein
VIVKNPSEFEQAAARGAPAHFVSECLAFLAYNKKWWLLPIAIVLLMLGGLVVLSSTAAAPFIYTLF